MSYVILKSEVLRLPKSFYSQGDGWHLDPHRYPSIRQTNRTSLGVAYVPTQHREGGLKLDLPASYTKRARRLLTLVDWLCHHRYYDVDAYDVDDELTSVTEPASVKTLELRLVIDGPLLELLSSRQISTIARDLSLVENTLHTLGFERIQHVFNHGALDDSRETVTELELYLTIPIQGR